MGKSWRINVFLLGKHILMVFFINTEQRITKG
jgi:hypothetical protein